LLRQRPDIVEAERKVAAASEGIGSARAEFFPTVNLQGAYGTDSAIFDQLDRGDSNTWSFGVSVSVPIFEGGRNAANLRAAKARRDATVAAYQQTTIAAFREVENALVDLRQRSFQSDIRGRAVASAAKVFQYSRDRYQEGAINYFDVIEAQRSLLNAQLSQVQTLNARYSATIDLIRAIGGAYPVSATAPGLTRGSSARSKAD
jgi:multidrug efflux system outer membrane protein